MFEETTSPVRAQKLAITNQKGGVGKTTTTINLATALAAVDRRVLIIDMDPQGNASTGLGIGHGARAVNTYNVLVGAQPVQHAPIPTSVPLLDIIAAVPELSGAEIELLDFENPQYRLRQMLTGVEHKYDYILIDCPPSLNMLTINALVASDAVLVPLQCEFFALEGLSQLLTTVDRVRRTLNAGLDIHGVVLTMFDRRNRLSEQVAADVRQHLGTKVYETVIPRNVRVSEAPSHGRPALLYDHRCAGSQAYIRLAGELLRRDRARPAAA